MPSGTKSLPNRLMGTLHTISSIYFYYPYNRGKKLGDTVWESHVGDWERVAARLLWQHDSEGDWVLKPSNDPEKASFLHSHHGEVDAVPWKDVSKVQDTEHPIAYVAQSSHAVYLAEDSYDTPAMEEELGKRLGMEALEFLTALISSKEKYRWGLEPLLDHTDRGFSWDTWLYLECFDYDQKRGLGPTWMGRWPSWLVEDTGDRNIGNEDPSSGPIWRWGNDRRGKSSVAGTYRLTRGGRGPVRALAGSVGTPELD